MGYLLASVLTLPVLVLITRPSPTPDAGPRATERVWSCAVLATACCALAVVTVRLWITWQS